MREVSVPFLFVNPKSYLYGKESLALAEEADRIGEKYGLQIFFTCPYADIRLLSENTENLIITAQNMDALRPGRGMGAVLPESLTEARAAAELGADVILAEPTELIGTGTAAGTDYIEGSVEAIRAVSSDTKVMIASGITTAEDCYKVIFHGADGVGSTSGIVKAPSPAKRIDEMASAVKEVFEMRGKS